jgi:Xaa-Pro aminopeptidase
MEKEELLCEQGYEIRSFSWFEDKETEIVFSLAGKAVGSDCGLSGSTDISGKVNPLRYSLTCWEVERYKALGKLAAICVEETAETVRPGDTECAIVGRLLKRLWARGADSVLPYCAADDRISMYRHPMTKNARVEKRAMICCNTRKWGLIVSMTRFVHFGKVPAALQKHYEDNVYVDSTFMTASIPGRSVIEAFNAGLAAYAERGYPEEYKLHHQGGAIGYVGRDYRTNFNTKDIICENQGFAWNPSIIDAKSEDTMLATSAGPVILTEPMVYPAMIVQKNGHTFRRAMMLEL